MKTLLLLSFMALSFPLFSQSVGIGTASPDSSAVLDVSGTTKGLLIPRMSSTDRQNIVDPAKGLMVYDTTNTAFYYFTGTGWLELLAGSVDQIADSDGDTKIQVEESADEDIIRFDLGGTEFFRMDSGRIDVVNTGGNVFLGDQAGVNGYGSDQRNTGIGANALTSTTSGWRNTAVGWGALRDNLTGGYNTVLGFVAGYSNQSGYNNTIVGAYAQYLSGGNNNVSIGRYAGYHAGSGNVFLGDSAGKDESGDNKLYIDNTDTIAPLIYGEFDNNLLRVNGVLSIMDQYTFPTEDGAAGEILTTDGSGTVSWEPPPPPPGSTDSCVSICCQYWITKNLDVTTYRNGDTIPKVTDDAEWAALTTGAYCYYDNDSATYAATYGKLYNWYAVNDSRGLAPEGWHIPTDFNGPT